VSTAVPERGELGKALLGIALTALAVGGAWTGVAIGVAVTLGKAIRLANRRAGMDSDGNRLDPLEEAGQVVPLLGVVRPGDHSSGD
jgi:hypothetical protein